MPGPRVLGIGSGESLNESPCGMDWPDTAEQVERMDDEGALEGARVWEPTQLDENFTDDHHDPRAMYEKAERQLFDDEFKQSYIIGSDPAHHVERIREIDKLGATVVCIQSGSGADPLGALRTYGKHVLGA